jgi:hypothetical protein
MSKIHFRDAEGRLEKIFEAINLQKDVAEIVNSSNSTSRFRSILAEVLVCLK